MSLGVSAQAEFKVPTLTGPVMDEVGLLQRDDRQELMQLLYDFNRRGTAQVQVLIVDSLQGSAHRAGIDSGHRSVEIRRR